MSIETRPAKPSLQEILGPLACRGAAIKALAAGRKDDPARAPLSAALQAALAAQIKAEDERTSTRKAYAGLVTAKMLTDEQLALLMVPFDETVNVAKAASATAREALDAFDGASGNVPTLAETERAILDAVKAWKDGLHASNRNAYVKASVIELRNRKAPVAPIAPIAE